MRLFKRNRQKSVVGVDIGSCSLKLVEARRIGDEYRVDHGGIEYLDMDSFGENGSLKKPEVVASSLKRLIQRLGVRTEDAVLGLDNTNVASSWISVPVEESEVEIEAYAEHEAVQMLDVAGGGVGFDYAVEPPTDGDPNKLVQVVAGNRRRIDDLVALAERAGLRPIIMDSQVMAIERAMSSMIGVGQSYIGVYLGNSHSYAFVQEDGYVAQSMVIPVDGMDFANRMAEFLGVSPNEAALQIRNRSFDGGADNEWLLQESAYVVEQVANVIGNIQAQTGKSGGKIILSGGNALLPRVPEMLLENHGLKSDLFKPIGPWSSMVVSDPAIKSSVSSMVVAIGLAMRGLV